MKKSVTVELDKARNLRYGTNALCTIEELTGKPISALDLTNLSIRDLRNILFAGLSHEDETLTPEIVGGLIDDYSDLTTISNKLGEAFTLAFGNQKNKKTPKQTTKVGG